MSYPIDVLATIPMKGREMMTEHPKNRPKTAMTIETPPLPYETQPVKIRRTIIPGSRPSSAISTQNNTERLSKLDGSYSKKLADSTWASDIPSTDRSPTREEIKNLDYRFEKNLSLVYGFSGIELAQRLQAVNDMLLDELVNQFRVLNLGQGKLLEKAREVYAQVFQILDDEADKSAKMIINLKKIADEAVEAKNRTVEEANARIEKVESECKAKVKEVEDRLDKKMLEFDENTKQVLEQKEQLETHVKALHHVFLDFQSDAVYLTLEELKTKFEQEHLRLVKKDEENHQLQFAISKWKHQYQDLLDNKKEIENVCEDLRNQLQQTKNKNSQLMRQIDKLKGDLEDAKLHDYSDYDDENSNDKKYVNQQKDAVQAPNPVYGRRKKRKSSIMKSNGTTTPFLDSYQKLCQIGNMLSDFIERCTGKPIPFNDQNMDEDELQLIQRDVFITEQIISQKINQLISFADCLNQIEGKQGRSTNSLLKKNRFLQYFSCGIAAPPPEEETNKKFNIFSEIRRIFQAKYLHDKWDQRANRTLMRFPEFIVCYYYKDDKKIGTALHKCKALWEAIEQYYDRDEKGNSKNDPSKYPEIDLFKQFVQEKLTLDELTFFLEIRNGLIGLPFIKDNESAYIFLPITKCEEVMNQILGAFSPVASLVGDEVKSLSDDGKIDYALFMKTFLKFYSTEREKRRHAVRLMIQSYKSSSDSETPIFLEIFVSILQGLNFQGSFEQMLDFYRQARLISNGDITLEGLLQAMDEMNIHFYSIDSPLEEDSSFDSTEISRKVVISHWAKFNQWFEGLRRSTTTLDTWVRSLLVLHVRRVDQAFQLNQSTSSLYTELRNLLDLFQFILYIMARGSPVSMKIEHSIKQLELLEEINEILLKFIIQSGTQQLAESKKI